MRAGAGQSIVDAAQPNGTWPTLNVLTWLLGGIIARQPFQRHGVAADLETIYGDLRAMLATQIRELEQRVISILVQENILAAAAELVCSMSGVRPVPAAMLLQEI